LLGSYQSPANLFIVLKRKDGDGFRGIVCLVSVAGKQTGFDIVKLIIIFAPMRGAVQPIAAMALKIDDARKVQLFEIVRLVEGILQIGAPPIGFRWRVLVDARSLCIDRPRNGTIKSRRDLSAVGPRDFEDRLERLAVSHEG